MAKQTKRSTSGKSSRKKTASAGRKRNATRSSKKRSSRKNRQRHPVRRLLLWGLVCLLIAGVLGGLWLNYDVQRRFTNHEWVLPARVFARPETFYKGRSLSAERLTKLLTLMRYRHTGQALSPGSYSHHGRHFMIYARGFKGTDGGEPSRRLSITLSNGQVASLTDAHGKPIAIARLEPLQIGSIHPGFNEDRIYVPLDKIPKKLVAFLLATEDRQYYQNPGVSFRGMARALYVDIRTGSFSQGGSTITQQLVKNLWLTNRRSILRKLVEIPMAMLLSVHYSKDQILEAYLNEAYLGQDGSRAIHGFGLAAQFYFGRPLNELSTPQLALLVGLLRGPSYYDPRRHPQQALKRRNAVLHNAVEVGVLDKTQYKTLSKRPLRIVPKGRSALYAFPAFIDLVKRQLHRDFSSQLLSRDGLQIRTTMDVLDQLIAEKSLTDFLKQKDPSGKGSLNGAVVMVAPNQGDVLALVGDRHPRRAGFNRALDTHRPIGSLAKPFDVLAALASRHYTLATLVPDEPISVPIGKNKTWSPDNFDHKSRGPIPLLEALVDSRNQAMAHVGMKTGPATVANTLKRLGLKKTIHPYPSILLGGFNLTPLQVAMVYQPIANGGFQTPLRSITGILDDEGKPLVRYPAESNQVIQPGVAYLVQWAMQQVVSHGTGRYAGKRLPDLHLAGKTGTSNNLDDSWFVGFSGSTLTVSWVGRDDDTSTGMTGATGALRVWENIMAKTPQHPLKLVQPDNVQMVWMNAEGNRRSGAMCHGSKQYPLLKDTLPKHSDTCGKVEKVKKGVMGWFKGLFGH